MGGQQNQYSIGLGKTPANFVALTPLSFLARTAAIYPDQTSTVYEDRVFTWSETHALCRRFASYLASRNIGPGDTVAAMLPNVPAMNEAHFAVPMAGAVLNALNIRLDAASIAFQLDHGGAKVILVDPEFAGVIVEALSQMKGAKPFVIDVDDKAFSGGARIGEIEYEDVLAQGDENFIARLPSDEWDAIALSYTSGTTGNPKGVVTHHRGAYLNAVANALCWQMPQFPRYLWTLPLFHCNGWCFPWTVAMLGGLQVCLRRVEARAILEAIRVHGVDHYCGAPIVHTMLINADPAWRAGLTQRVRALVAGAAPPVAMIEGMQRIGFDLTHVYGLTETYGPAAVAAKRAAWADESIAEQARLNGRQGVRYVLEEGMTVLEPENMSAVPADGKVLGEVMFRGNIVMKGYLKNPQATAAAFAGGWFHTGDLGVLEPDRYVKIRDRSKDVIISGGENISSLEVEDALYRHPAVQACAVVARPDPKWGESPLAYVELRSGASATAQELMLHCRGLLAGYKVPREVRFEEIPKTATGKIQKFLLRERARSSNAIE